MEKRIRGVGVIIAAFSLVAGVAHASRSVEWCRGYPATNHPCQKRLRNGLTNNSHLSRLTRYPSFD
jgi:hypothetical protein